MARRLPRQSISSLVTDCELVSNSNANATDYGDFGRLTRHRQELYLGRVRLLQLFVIFIGNTDIAAFHREIAPAASCQPDMFRNTLHHVHDPGLDIRGKPFVLPDANEPEGQRARFREYLKTTIWLPHRPHALRTMQRPGGR